MSDLVEVVMNYFSKIDEHVLLNLNLSVLVDFDPRGVNDAKIANEVFSVLADDHQLRLPKFLVIWNLVVVGVSLPNFEYTQTAVESDC